MVAGGLSRLHVHALTDCFHNGSIYIESLTRRGWTDSRLPGKERYATITDHLRALPSGSIQRLLKQANVESLFTFLIPVGNLERIVSNPTGRGRELPVNEFLWFQEVLESC